MYIAVSGNLASGKTTVARGLAKAFNCAFYPRQSYNRSYIEDLFREPLRWTAEAQISFMVHKYGEIRHGLDEGSLFVLDRSFDEEVEVFAERFHEEGKIENRSMGLIRQIAADLRLRLEQPSLIVFCDSSTAACEERLRGRPRSYQDLYPRDHLVRLERTIEDWLARQKVPIVRVDTNALDFRQEANALALARRIDEILTRTRTDQLELFAADAERSTISSSHGMPSLLRRRQVYLAAPFTSRAILRPSGSEADGNLFQEAGQGEDIPAAYRRRLGALARAIESHGHEVMLPHRDINRWGRRSLSASEVASRCLAAVAAADCFVGLIAESFGSHAELAYALALGKPSLVLISEREPTSFFGQGMAAMSGVAVLRGRSLGTLTTAVRQMDPLATMTWRHR